MLPRDIYDDEHRAYRDTARSFLEKHLVPYHEQWEKEGVVDRAVWELAGSHGHLCHWADPIYGGAGVDDFRFAAVLYEEQARLQVLGPAFPLHSDVIAPYIRDLGTDEQRQRWLPGMVAGTAIGAIAITEPGTGSDVASIATSARRTGDNYVLNGAKTFISNGTISDTVIVVARTDPHPHRGLTLFVVDGDTPGFERGQRLNKLGMKAQDTSELFFDDCVIHESQRLGEENAGFYYLMQNLPTERLTIAIQALGAIRRAFELSASYADEREVFGEKLSTFQNTQFQLADLATGLQVAEIFVDRCVDALRRGELTPDAAAMAKLWTTELQLKAVDAGLQIHGGYGYTTEYPISRLYADSRAQTIYGGSSEIMRLIIARSLQPARVSAAR